MSEPENFIARWSRRKAEATTEHAEPAAAPADETVAPDDQAHGAPAPVKQSESAPPAIDPATLPPIESIMAGTDISVFLRAGVPAELTRAALRRAWATDPNIRDFIGLSENSWDFTANDGVPGFGPLSAEDASRLMVEFTSKAKEVAGKAKEVVERIDALEPKPVQTTELPAESGAPPVRSAEGERKTDQSAQDELRQVTDRSNDVALKYSVQRDKEYIATQQALSDRDANTPPTPRGHGRALPK